MPDASKNPPNKALLGLNKAASALHLASNNADKKDHISSSHKRFPNIFGKKQLSMTNVSTNMKLKTGSFGDNDVKSASILSPAAQRPHHNTNPFMSSNMHKSASDEKYMTYNPYGSITKTPTFGTPPPTSRQLHPSSATVNTDASNSAGTSRNNSDSTANSLGFYLADGKGKSQVLSLPILDPNTRLPKQYQSLNSNIFDDFDLLNNGKSIGQGGSSEVKLVKNKLLKQVYILKKFKVLKSESDADFYDRIVKEYMISKLAMGNINIVNTFQLLKVSTTSNVTRGWGFVMEYFPQGDLFSLITSKMWPMYKYEEKLCLFKQICSGVKHLHSLGIAHRDLKPENVLISERGVAKVIDFGISITGFGFDNSETTAEKDETGNENPETTTVKDETTAVKDEKTTEKPETTTEKAQPATENAETGAVKPETTTDNAETVTEEPETGDCAPETTTDKAETTTDQAETTTEKPETTTEKAETNHGESQSSEHITDPIMCFSYAGSPPYVPPEVFRFSEKHALLNPLTPAEKKAGYDAKLFDSWSLGVILYTLLSVKNPFKEPTKQDANFREYTNIYYQWLQYAEKERDSSNKVTQYPLGPSVELKLLQHIKSRDLSRVLCRLLSVDVKRRYTLLDLFDDPCFKAIVTCVSLEPQDEHVCSALRHRKEPLMVPCSLQESQRDSNKKQERQQEVLNGKDGVSNGGISSSPLDSDGHIIIPEVLKMVQEYKNEQREVEETLKEIYNSKLHAHYL